MFSTKFKTAEELLTFLTDNVRTSYKERYSKVELSPPTKTGKGIRRITFRTPFRADLHDSIQELLTTKRVTHKVSLNREQTNLEVIDIETTESTVRILIKPKLGKEWRQQSYWNQRLENLIDKKVIKKGFPDTQIEFAILTKINKKIASEFRNLNK